MKPPLIKNISFPLQDPYIFEPNCQMKVDEYGFFITWKSEGKVQPPTTSFLCILLSFKAKRFSVSSRFLEILLFLTQPSILETCQTYRKA